MNGIPWTEERQKQLRELASRRLSAAEIGERMGMTRNAIIGRCYRTDVNLMQGNGGGHNNKLSPDQVRAVLVALAYGESQRTIGDRFGVCQQTISLIKTRRHYKQVTL